MKKPSHFACLVGALAASLCTVALAGEGKGDLLGALTQQNQPGNAGSHDRVLSSFDQFTHWWFILRLVLGLLLSVALSALTAMHPRRSTRLDPLSDLEERKTLILLEWWVRWWPSW